MSHLLAKAAENGNLPDLLRLLDAGADIEWTHKGTGRSALLFATLAGHPALVTALLDRGAQIDRQCKALGYSALAWAAHEGDMALVQLLIERGADLDLASPELRRTPLMCAAQAGQAEALEQLLQAGADGRLLDFKQQNAWALARDKGHETIMQRLEQAGAGAPPAAERPPTLAWPDTAAEPTSDPVQVVRAYTLAMHAWEHQGNALSAADPEHHTPPDFWAQQQQIVARYCTPRPRAYQHQSYGVPTTYAPSDQLLGCEPLSGTRSEVLIRDSRERGGVQYEHRFVVKCSAGAWRIDSVKRRMAGTDTWRSGIL